MGKIQHIQHSRTEHDRRIGEKLRRELGPVVYGFLADPTVIEIMLNPDGTLWVERLGEPMECVGTMPAPQAESLMGTVASTLKTHITAQAPMRAVAHVDMTQLLKAAMRLRPDRIIVGEVRDGSALALLKAWNTGHPGGVATVHANSAPAGLIRIEQLVAEATQAPMQALLSIGVEL